MKRLFILSMLIVPLLLFNCKGVKDSQSGTTQTQTLEELVKSKYKDQGSILYNKSKTYALVQSVSKKSDAPGQSSIHFFIYDVSASEIILEDFVNQGSVQWTNDTLVKITKVPGVYKEGASKGYVFDVMNKTRDAIE